MNLRVNSYFKENGISKYGNGRLIVKTVFMLCLALGPLFIVNLGLISSISVTILLYMLSGLGMSGLGMGVMHDANHGSYSKNRKVNKLLGYTMNLMGANAKLWIVQHNVLHHTYTNVKDMDDDLNTIGILRFTPNDERKPIHKFQYLYFWFLYGLSTISWVTSKDFIRAKEYCEKGIFSNKKDINKELAEIAMWKVIYFSYTIILPIVFAPVAFWVILLAFLAMHFVTGFCLTMVFQTAHVVPSSEFPIADDNGLVANDWTIHQLVTTANFAPNNKILTWLIGGLNYQIEHHLLPHISHVHYSEISKIVKKTAEEYGIPYNTKKTFGKAILDHVDMLKTLGRYNTYNDSVKALA